MYGDEGFVATIWDWRDSIADRVDEVADSLDDLKATPLVELDSLLIRIQDDLDRLRNAVPCREGTQEFIERLQSRLHNEDCVPLEDVVLSVDMDVSDIELQERGFVRIRHVEDLVAQMLHQMALTQMALRQIAADMSLTNWDPSNTVTDRVKRSMME